MMCRGSKLQGASSVKGAEEAEDSNFGQSISVPKVSSCKAPPLAAPFVARKHPASSCYNAASWAW